MGCVLLYVVDGADVEKHFLEGLLDRHEINFCLFTRLLPKPQTHF